MVLDDLGLLGYTRARRNTLSAVKVIQNIFGWVVGLVAIVLIGGGGLALFLFTLYISNNPH